MCGITGILHLDRDKPVDSRLLDAMTDSLHHRGPDARGTYIDGSLGLGFRRLSIIDLSPSGNQPMSNESDDIWIVFNGEIYNYKELRVRLIKSGHRLKSNTDTEVVIHLYEEYGTGCLEYIDGMFAFAIWDCSQKKLFLARDRFGIKPLVYYYHNGLFAFASEIKSLLKIPELAKDIDPNAISEYLSALKIPAPLTVYKHIRKMLPSQALTIDSKYNYHTWQYWDLNIEQESDKPESYWLELLSSRLEDSLRRHLNADVPVGIFLSGGVDSGAVAAFASSVLSQPVKTFSVSFDTEGYDESPYQEMISKHIGSEHYTFKARPDIVTASELIIRQLDEPFAVYSAIPLYYISKMASEHVKVALSGDGGDETFAGYTERYGFFSRLERIYTQLPIPWKFIYSILGTFSPLAGKHPFFQRLQRITGRGAASNNERLIHLWDRFDRYQKKMLLDRDFFSQIDICHNEQYDIYLKSQNISNIDKILYFDFKAGLPDEMMAKIDACTSMVSIEGRVPLLDKNLVETVFKIPIDVKYNDNNGKIILKKLLESRLPTRALYREKMGFSVPVSDYLRKCPPEGLVEGVPDIVNKAFVRKMLKEHLEHKKDWGIQLWLIENLRIWYRQYQELSGAA